MAQFKSKTSSKVVQMITFDELIQHGLNQQGANIVDGFPWSFEYEGQPITHENNECYLIAVPEGNQRITPEFVVIKEESYSAVCYNKQAFENDFEILNN